MSDIRKDPFEEYVKQAEISKKDKGYAWQTAIGLQAVDGIKPSNYLIETAIKNIEGEISFDHAEELLNTYYKENKNNSPEDRTEEADKVSVRIASILSEKAFNFAPAEYISIHKRLFDGIYKHAGKLRDYNITKNEWVLSGNTVTYGSAYNLRETLEYDFDTEKNFSYKGLSKDEIISHIATFISNLWQIHIFGEGNTRTTAVFLIKYLRKLGYDVTNDSFSENAWYFRNALVRANYTDLQNDIHETKKYLELFLRNLLLNENNPLHNRDMHISGVFNNKKQDIETEKQDIEMSNVLKMIEKQNFTKHTKNNIAKCYKKFGKGTIFGRTDIATILGLTPSPASELIKKMLDSKLIESVNGKGKGKYKFI